MNSCSSATLEVTSGVPQGSLLGPLLFFIFINDLPDLLKFSEPFIFADDLKLLFTGKADWQIQEDLNSSQDWAKTNKMDLATEKFAALKMHHHSGDLILGTSQRHSADTIKHLGIFVTKDMTWFLHVSEKLKKANRSLYRLRRNVSPKVNVSVKLGLYKSILLPILLCGMNCLRLSRGSTRDLESFQKRALNWVCYESNRSYLQHLRLLNVLPLPLFMQCNDILLLSKLLVEGEHNINIPTCNPESGESTKFFKLNKCKKEKTRGDLFYRTCRLKNRKNEKKIQFANPLGLKSRKVSLMWKFVDNRFSDSNPCAWQLCGDCCDCHNIWTSF